MPSQDGAHGNHRRLAVLNDRHELYDTKIAKWWTPDDVIFVDAIPLGATGKVQKSRLREQFGDHLMAWAAN
ncbi:hypothetical protein [Cupriavidus basilensis]|uniref:Uncharacterized protein n=1 Tax=Cupriavidus necator TaxID=106590 RepID=A0A2P1DV12_CUPNE|nr:hypothetical protein BJN34_0285 [Cupriavidus necator]